VEFEEKEMTVIRTPVRRKNPPGDAEKRRKRTPKPGRLRPSSEPDGKLKHGAWSLDKLLKADLDKRLTIARERDALEAELVDHAGGVDALTPSMTLLIKRITHKSLVAAQAEKAALLGMFNLSGKHYLALSNSLRLDIAELERLLRQKRPRPVKTLAEIIEAESK
jgi:hypothetical protein